MEADSKDPSQRLLAAARAGDASALARLLRDLWPWIRRTARRYVARKAPPLGVSTLTQETTLRLSHSVKNIRALSSPAVKALIKRIMENTGTSAFRQAMSQKRAAVALPEDDPQATPEQIAGDEEKEARLRVAIARLPLRQQQAITLLREGYGTKEIAAKLGCSVSAAQMLLQRAKNQLAELLRDQDE